MKNKPLMLVALIIFFVHTDGFAQLKKVGQSGMTYLAISLGARESAMGNASVASVKGTQAIFYNPAILAESEGFGLAVNSVTWLADTKLYGIAAMYGLGQYGAFGVDLVYMDYGKIIGTQRVDKSINPDGYIFTGDLNIEDYAIGFAYAYAVNERFSFGFKIKYVHEDLGDAAIAIKAIDELSLDVPAHHITALVGPDGAGKTTLMRAICNLIEINKGEITIQGKNINEHFERIKPNLGYMPQVFSLYPDLSVEENLKFYAGIFDVTGKEFKTKAEEMYKFSNLKPFKDRRALDLSGGMKQKLALSCALMHDPEILILDEPTTGVDPLSRRQFWEILAKLKNDGVTILVSTPYMDEVARADFACFIFDGKKLTEGTPEQLPNLFDGQLFYLDKEPTAALVRQLNTIEGIEARRFGAGMHLLIKQNDSIENYMQKLQAVDIASSLVKPIKPDLEDCFIQFMEQL